MYQNRNQTTRRVAMVSVSLLLVLSLLAVMLPQQRYGAVALAATCSTYHTVASGETLSSIALKYNVTVAELASANDLKEPYQIFVGQRLCIPGSTSATPAATQTASTTKGPDFTVKTGTQPFTVEIATVGYPKNSSYLVRLERATSGAGARVKIGTMRTDKNGVAKRVFRIPNKFRTAPFLTFCLKNAQTDAVQCHTYTP
jgi:murein DD-endopeptidase MepM/ murein hydrolase activator NlpD